MFGEAPIHCQLEISAHMTGFVIGVLADARSYQHRLPPVVEGSLDISIEVVADHHVVCGLTIQPLHVLVDELEGFTRGFAEMN